MHEDLHLGPRLRPIGNVRRIPESVFAGLERQVRPCGAFLEIPLLAIERPDSVLKLGPVACGQFLERQLYLLSVQLQPDVLGRRLLHPQRLDL